MASRKAILSALTLLSRAFAGDITPERVDVYAAALEDLEDEQLQAAIARVIREHTGPFIPPPAVVRNAAGANTKATLDIARVISRIHKLGEHTGHGYTPPSVPTVRQAMGPLIAGAYAATDMDRLFSETETTREIARRDFATFLRDAVETWGPQKLPRWATVPLPGPTNGLKQLTAGTHVA